jgi:integrase/recombinase XerC
MVWKAVARFGNGAVASFGFVHHVCRPVPFRRTGTGEAVIMPEPLDSPVRSFAQANRELADAFDRYMVVRNYAATTQKFYSKVLRDFLEFIRAESVAGVDTRVIRSFLAEHRAKGAGAGTVSGLRSALRAFYKFLVFGGIVRASPAQHIEIPKASRKLPRCPSEREVERLIQACVTLRDRALIEFLYASGLRAAEVANLRLDEMDLDGGKLMVRHGKGNRDRLAFLGTYAAQAIGAYIGRRRRGPLFLNPLGHAIGPRTIGKIVRETAERAGLPGLHTHSLRHAFATHLLNRGAGIRYVQELLGHVSVSTTHIYTHTAIADLVRAHSTFHPHGGNNEEN